MKKMNKIQDYFKKKYSFSEEKTVTIVSRPLEMIYYCAI